MTEDIDKIYKFECVVEYEKFFSETNFYGAYNVTTNKELPHSQLYKGFTFDNGEKIYFINLAGKMQRLYLGCKYLIEAKLSFSPKYNCWQYTPEEIKAIKPTNAEDNKKFLESILTKSQSDTLLASCPDIVDKIINGEQVDLSNTKGIKEKTFEKIKEKVINTYAMSDLLTMLQPLGITLKMIQKISSLEQNVTILKKKIKENPYILTQIKGLGFKKVDGIAIKINPNIRISKERTIAFIKYFFSELGSNKGDTWCTLNRLDREINTNITECYDIYKDLIDSEREKGKLLYIFDDRVGLLKYYKNEINVYNLLKDINKYSIDYSKELNSEISIMNSQKRLGFQFTDEQKNAIISTLDNGVTIITAKSGAGKTTSINGILDLYKNISKIALCSLSAKASRRMTEATGSEAYTIHKLLGFGKSLDKSKSDYLYNENNPLDYDIVILDEASMVNVEMFLHLLRAIKPTGKIIIVFDNAQLPPIGYGNIATDLLLSDFNICKLTKVHRQAEKSGILVDGNKIREQQFPISKPTVKEVHGELKDMCYMFRNSREQIQSILVNSYIKYSQEVGVENTAIIVPRKQECINSIREINKIIQDELVKSKIGINRGDTIFKKGARVIQKTNDGEKGVINGELGYIKEVWKERDKENKEKEFFQILFDDGKIVDYSRDDIGDIELGYAITIHSSQGSEYNTVLVGIDNTHFSLLSSNLLYTAITRAKKRCLLVSEPTAFKTCIRKKMDNRNTFLSIELQKTA